MFMGLLSASIRHAYPSLALQVFGLVGSPPNQQLVFPVQRIAATLDDPFGDVAQLVRAEDS